MADNIILNHTNLRKKSIFYIKFSKEHLKEIAIKIKKNQFLERRNLILPVIIKKGYLVREKEYNLI